MLTKSRSRIAVSRAHLSSDVIDQLPKLTVLPLDDPLHAAPSVGRLARPLRLQLQVAHEPVLLPMHQDTAARIQRHFVRHLVGTLPVWEERPRVALHLCEQISPVGRLAREHIYIYTYMYQPRLESAPRSTVALAACWKANWTKSLAGCFRQSAPRRRMSIAPCLRPKRRSRLCDPRRPLRRGRPRRSATPRPAVGSRACSTGRSHASQSKPRRGSVHLCRASRG